MCTYTLMIDDKLVEQIRPAFKDEVAIKEWLQNQVEVLFTQFVANKSKEQNSQKRLSERLRGIGVAPKDFDYKKELSNRLES